MKRILSSIVVAILLTLPVSAFCVSLGNYVELNNATEISNVTELRNVQDLGGLESETIAFVERVIADGGTVEDVEFLNAFIVDAKANNYYSDIVAAYSPSWGVKGTTTASKLYSLIGASQDLEQTTGASQPAINHADLIGKTRLGFDGINSSIGNLAFSWGSSARTVIIGGAEQESWTFNDRLTDDSVSGTRIRQEGATPQLILFDGVLDPNIRNSALAISAPGHIDGVFNGASSSLKINNANETTGNIGVTNGNGIMLGASLIGSNNAHYTGGMWVLLKVAATTAQRTIIYNFSKAAYGTP